MKKFISFILCLFPIILLSLTFEHEKINEFAVSGDYGNRHRLFIEDNFMYALSHYGLEIHTVDEVTGELNRISIIPIEGDADDLIKIGTSVFVSVSSIFRRQDEILSAIYKIDVSNPYDPIVVDSIIFPENIKNYILRTYRGYLAYHKLEDINNEFIITQLVFIDPITLDEILSFPINNWTCSLRENYFLKKRELVGTIFDVYDYTDISNIQVIGSVDFEECPTDFFFKMVAIDDNTLVLLGNESISIYDISVLSNIQLISTYYKYNNASPFGDCLQIDNFLLIPSQGTGIEVVDITDLENPTLFDFWEYPIDELSIIDPFFITLAGIIYDNGHIYIGSYHHGILLMNFNSGIIEYVDNFTNNRTNKEFQIYNNYLITSGFSKGLYVYDIENVNSPELITILLEELDIQAFGIINNHIYLIHLNTELDYYFCVYDIFDFSNPILKWEELLNVSPLLIVNENEPENIYVLSFVNSFQSIEMRKYNITDPGNLEQILLYEYPEIFFRLFFHNGYLYALGMHENGGADLFIFDGFEDENPEMVNQITNFVDGSNIQIINSYLNTSSSSPFGRDSFYNLDDPINPELTFTIQNTSTFYKNYYIDNVLFSPGRYTVFLYDLENDPSGELEPFDYFNLNSEYRGVSFFSQGEEDYFFSEQLECISTYSYSIETSAEDELPKPAITLNNYPNPFNPETTIQFNLIEGCDVQIDIYNIKGQKINSIVNEHLLNGEHSITWNGEDSSGKKVGSGLYLYKLLVNGKTEIVKKCMLLK